MIDLKLEGQDIVIGRSGDLLLTQSLKELLKQRMEITFRAFTGEWYLNPAWGGFNRDILYNKQATKDILDAFYRDIIISFPEVVSIPEFISFYSSVDRVYSFQFQVETVEETAGFRINLVPPGVEIAYPYFPTELEAIGCTAGVDAATQNRFYELLNIDLPVNIPWF
jgi:hypothetical protein